jgi:hypothetical protein
MSANSLNEMVTKNVSPKPWAQDVAEGVQAIHILC